MPERSQVVELDPDARLVRADRPLLRSPLLRRSYPQPAPLRRHLVLPRHRLPKAAAAEAGSLLPRR